MSYKTISLCNLELLEIYSFKTQKKKNQDKNGPIFKIQVTNYIKIKF